MKTFVRWSANVKSSTSPGRFFAITEMMLMFAELISRYDMKLEPGTAPKEIYIATMVIPETKLPILFKRR
jgi:cytochrome P450